MRKYNWVFPVPVSYTHLKAGDALEEALCFGWIDGVMKRIDDESYIKYFSARRKDSKWSEKNKALAEDLEKRGLMTDFGREKILEARKNGQWDKPSGPPAVTAEQIGTVAGLLKEHEPAYTNFQKMPPSVQKTYTRASVSYTHLTSFKFTSIVLYLSFLLCL